MPKTEADYRRACQCEDCRKTRAALALLDTMSNTPTWMATDDITMLLKAREILAGIVGAAYNEATNRYDSRP